MKRTFAIAILAVAVSPTLLAQGIKPQFDDARGFSDGLAPVKISGKWGYIDKTGGVVITPQFNDAEDFSEGLAAVEVGSNVGYINKTGTLVIKPQFDAGGKFSEGLAGVRKSLT